MTEKFNVDEVHFIEKAEKLTGNQPRMSKEEMDFWIKQAQEFVRPRTPEEIEQINKDLRYPGLPPHMRVKPNYTMVPKRREFFGIMIGWWYE